MSLQARFPAGPPTSAQQTLASLAAAPRLSVGDPRILDFLASLSRRLLAPSLARRQPELGSLGFFLRRRELARTLARLNASGSSDTLLFPRGLVFHLPPANVDTIFIYSWALSALAGNANIVRISSRSAVAAQVILDALNECLAGADPVVASTQRMLTYGHDDETTARFSAECDLRVIWGGDGAVQAIRRHQLRPSARDLTFPDRSSYAVVSVAAWQQATTAVRQDAAARFANDAYWFDQAACSSPRAVFLVGSAGAAAQVEADFVERLAEAVRARGWEADASMEIEKRVGSYGVAADGGASRITFTGNAVAAIDLTGPAATPRHWLGAGTFGFVVLSSLAELVEFARRGDQTLSYFGFTRPELDQLARELGGRGIDRMVPFGSALTFAPIWDGYELIREFTRLVTIS